MKRLYTLPILLTLFIITGSLPAFARLKDSVKIAHPAKPVGSDKMRMLLFILGQRETDEEKVDAFKQNVKNKGFKVAQLGQLLNQFESDKWKLECATYAYPNLVDYKLFLNLTDLFANDKYKDQLIDFYKKNKKRST